MLNILFLYSYLNFATAQDIEVCKFDRPIHAKEFIDAINSGCSLSVGTTIVVGVKEDFDDKFKEKLEQLSKYLVEQKSIKLIAIEIHTTKLKSIEEEIQVAKNTGQRIVDYLANQGVKSYRTEVRVMDSSSKEFIDIRILKIEK